MNAREQLTGATYGSTLTATYGFDTYGYPSSTATGTVQDYRYVFDATTGNLTSRQNYKRSLSESFTYDNLDRLTGVSGPQNLTMTFSANGNLSTKSDISTTDFGYGTSAGPYALTGVSSSTGVIPTTDQTATYTSFEKVSTLSEGVYSATFIYNSDNQRAKMDVAQSGTNILTRWYAGSSYMKETAGAVTKEYTYIGGDAYTAPVAAVTQSGTTTYYYLLRDYLGNITHQVNTSNVVVAEYNFDAWGRRRSADDWSYTLDANDLALFADRGFTGHETLSWFNLVNMNGRLYDPLVGRFLNVDPYVQSPDNSQNFNRYSYCLNNPLRYTDPDGEFFVIDSWIIGLFSGGWKEANKRAGNDIKIWGGLFVSDPNKSFFGRVWETISRFTWQLPQTIGGWGTAQSYNTFGLKGGVESVDYKYGATVVKTRDGGWGGITQGSYIVGDNSIEADANNPLFQHEYGHYIQSQSMGWAYYPRVGIPSLKSKGEHDFHAVEQDANRRAFLYFNKNIEGFQDDAGLWDNRGWNFWNNPLNINGTNTRGQYVDYRDPNQVNSLDVLRVRAKWYDHASWLLLPIGGPIWVGLINSGIYNR